MSNPLEGPATNLARRHLGLEVADDQLYFKQSHTVHCFWQESFRVGLCILVRLCPSACYDLHGPEDVGAFLDPAYLLMGLRLSYTSACSNFFLNFFLILDTISTIAVSVTPK